MLQVRLCMTPIVAVEGPLSYVVQMHSNLRGQYLSSLEERLTSKVSAELYKTQQKTQQQRNKNSS